MGTHPRWHGLACVKVMWNINNFIPHLWVITYPDHAESKFPLCEATNLNSSLSEHILSQHIYSRSTWDDLMNLLVTTEPLFFLWILFHLWAWNMASHKWMDKLDQIRNTLFKGQGAYNWRIILYISRVKAFAVTEPSIQERKSMDSSSLCSS